MENDEPTMLYVEQEIYKAAFALLALIEEAMRVVGGCLPDLLLLSTGIDNCLKNLQRRYPKQVEEIIRQPRQCHRKIIALPRTAHEMESALHAICDHDGLWEYTVTINPDTKEVFITVPEQDNNEEEPQCQK